FNLLAALWAQAQSTGNIRGVMTDDSGAVIPAATVTVAGTGALRTVQTQADGSYTVSGLTPGAYHVRVNFPGFAPFDKPVTMAPEGAPPRDPHRSESFFRRIRPPRLRPHRDCHQARQRSRSRHALLKRKQRGVQLAESVRLEQAGLLEPQFRRQCRRTARPPR